jgi:PAS domain S-box-containing protein
MLLGLGLADISPERQPDGGKSSDKAREHIVSALKDGSCRFEWVCRDFEGKELVIDISLTAIPSADRQLVSVVWRDFNERRRVEEALVKSESKYRGIFESLPDGFALVDMERRFIEANAALQRMLGYTLEELRQLPRERLTPPEWLAFEENFVRDQVLRKGYSDVYEKEYLRKDGTRVPVELRIHLQKDDEGNPVEMWGFVRDISERKRQEEALREAEERYRMVVHLSPIGVFIEVNQKIEFANPALAHMLGARKPEELSGKSVFRFIQPDYWQVVRERKAGIMAEEKKAAVLEEKYVRFYGTVIDVQVAAFPFTYQGQAGTMVVVEDITRQKQAEESLRQRERELEDKSGHLEEANAALKVLLRQRDEDKKALESTILANMTHLVFPYIRKLRSRDLSDHQSMYLNIVESNLKEIMSPFLQKMTAVYAHFTPTELQIADLIKNGGTSKEIAEFLKIGTGTVHSHRNNIRSKLGLSKKNVNLRTYLLSLQE